MLVFQTNPLGVELFSYVKDFFVPRNLLRCWPREWKHSIKRTTNSTGIRANWINCLLYKVLLNLHILPVLSKKCTEPYLGPLHRSYIYIAIYIHVLCKKTVPQESCFFSHWYIFVKGQHFDKNIFCKKRSCPKCCWRIQLVFILKLLSLYKCFLAYFSISKIKHALPYVTDAFIVPNSYKQISCCFYGLTSCSVCCKN